MNEVNNAVKISDLVFKPNKTHGGSHAVSKFDNGYLASVVTGGWAYTAEDAPYEIAAMYVGKLGYDTPITDDIIGYLTEEAANEVLQQIANLPKRGEQR